MKKETKQAIDEFVGTGLHPGGFLEAVLVNDLFGAWFAADPYNWKTLGEILSYVYNEIPGGCWGTMEAFNKWRAQGGMAGRVQRGG